MPSLPFRPNGLRSLLVDVFEVRVYDARAGSPAGVARGGRWRLRLPAFSVHLGADLLRLSVESINRIPQHRDVVRGQDLPQSLELLLDRMAGRFGNLGAVLLQEFLRRVDELF